MTLRWCRAAVGWAGRGTECTCISAHCLGDAGSPRGRWVLGVTSQADRGRVLGLGGLRGLSCQGLGLGLCTPSVSGKTPAQASRRSGLLGFPVAAPGPGPLHARPL